MLMSGCKPCFDVAVSPLYVIVPISTKARDVWLDLYLDIGQTPIPVKWMLPAPSEGRLSE